MPRGCGGTVCPRIYLAAQKEKDNLATMVEVKDRSMPVEVVLKQGWKFAGRVTDMQDKPVPAARVQMGALAPCIGSQIGSEEFTDADGRFELKALPKIPEGVQYRISIDATGYGPMEFAKVELVEIPGNRFEDKTFKLIPANMSVSGMVADGSGRPVAGAELFLSGYMGKGSIYRQPRREATTNSRGEFTIGRLCEGPVRIQAGVSNDPNEVGFAVGQAGDKNVRVILGKDLTKKEKN
jgi:hypothetical protein